MYRAQHEAEYKAQVERYERLIEEGGPDLPEGIREVLDKGLSAAQGLLIMEEAKHQHIALRGECGCEEHRAIQARIDRYEQAIRRDMVIGSPTPMGKYGSVPGRDAVKYAAEQFLDWYGRGYEADPQLMALLRAQWWTQKHDKTSGWYEAYGTEAPYPSFLEWLMEMALGC